MFEIGDAVVHPTRGAGVITGFKELQRRGESEKYYKIKLLGQARSTLMIPVKRADEVGIRPVTQESEMSRVWQVLRATPRALPADYRDRRDQLEHALRTGDVIELAETVRDLGWRKRQEEGLGIRGRRIFERAVKLLASEIAAVENSGLKETEIQIKACLRESMPTSGAPADLKEQAEDESPLRTAFQKGKTWFRQALDSGG